MSDSDIITWPKIMSGAPSLLVDLPRVAKGLYRASHTQENESVGLGLALEIATDKFPNNNAIAHGSSTFTYKAFNTWVNQIAHYFTSQGLAKGDSVTVLIENRPELLAISAAAAKIGAVASMVNTSQTGDALTHSFTLVESKFFIIGEEKLAEFEEIRSRVISPGDRVYYIADQDTSKQPGTAPEHYENLMALSRDNPSHNPTSTKSLKSTDSCFYIFTSGTTGLPKASIVSHGRWMKAYNAFGHAALRLKSHDVFYVTLPFYHATALVACWGSAIAGGATLAIGRKFSASRFWDETRFYGATTIAYIGELCRYLMHQPMKQDDKLNPVKKMFGNGLRPAIWKTFKDRFDIDCVIEIYASSEGNVGFTNLFNLDNTVGFSPMNFSIVEYDKDNEIPIRDSQGFLKPVKKYGTGLLIAEICDKAPFDGYTNDDKSEQKILRDVFIKGDAYFDTGDLMRDLGFKHTQFVDRMGDTFRWKGENVSTTELENIANTLPGIKESVAYGVEIPHTNGRAGMIAISLEDGVNETDISKLYQYFEEKLPDYAIPRFVRLKAELDKTGTFKYKKTDLKNQGYNPKSVDDPLFVLLPGETEYSSLDYASFEKINEGSYRF